VNEIDRKNKSLNTNGIFANLGKIRKVMFFHICMARIRREFRRCQRDSRDTPDLGHITSAQDIMARRHRLFRRFPDGIPVILTYFSFTLSCFGFSRKGVKPPQPNSIPLANNLERGHPQSDFSNFVLKTGNYLSGRNKPLTPRIVSGLKQRLWGLSGRRRAS